MEKVGKYNEVFAHHNAEAYLDAYLDAAGTRDEKKSPYFVRSTAGFPSPLAKCIEPML